MAREGPKRREASEATQMTQKQLTIRGGLVTFELNGKGYETDQEALTVLRSIMPAAKASGDMSAVIAVMDLGEATGRIREMVR